MCILPCGAGLQLGLRHRFHKPRSQFISQFVFLVLLMNGVRFGEAKHPGPSNDSCVDSDTFCIGCFNPTGLAGKAAVINEYLAWGDVWSIAETHLSTRSLSSFRRGLSVTQSPFRFLASGFPVPVRQHSQSSGTWKGVAVLAKHPTRSVPTGWDPDIARSGRAMVSATLLHDM